jgi:hypothetical protein
VFLSGDVGKLGESNELSVRNFRKIKTIQQGDKNYLNDINIFMKNINRIFIGIESIQ